MRACWTAVIVADTRRAARLERCARPSGLDHAVKHEHVDGVANGHIALRVMQNNQALGLGPRA